MARSMGSHNGRQLLLCQVKYQCAGWLHVQPLRSRLATALPNQGVHLLHHHPGQHLPGLLCGLKIQIHSSWPVILWKRLILRVVDAFLIRICQNCRCQVWRMLIAATILTYKLTNGTHESLLLPDLISMQRWLDDSAAGFGAAWIL